MSGFTYRPVVPAVCGRLGTGGRSSGLGGNHHDIEKLHFHNLAGKTKKMLVINMLYVHTVNALIFIYFSCMSMSFLRLTAPFAFGACFLELSAAVGDAMQLRLPCHPDRRKTILQYLSEDLRLYTLKINIMGVWNILWSSLTVIFLNLYPTLLCIPSLLCHRWHPNSSPQYLLWNIWNVLAHSVVDGNLLTRVSLVMLGGIVIHWDWDVVMGSQVNWKHASEEVQLLSHPQSLPPGMTKLRLLL